MLALVAAAGAERLTNMRLNKITAVKNELQEKVDVLELRAAQEQKEKAECGAKLDDAVRINSAVRWETDPTNLLRSMSEAAVKCEVQLTSAELITSDRNSGPVLDGKFGRMRYEAVVKGRYKGLVQFINAVEHSPHVMLIDKSSLTASRQEQGIAEAHLTITSLHRLPDKPPAEPAAAKGTVARGESRQ